MKQKLIKLTEGDLHNIIKEAVQKTINEEGVETGIEYYDNQREMYRSLNNVRNLQSKTIQALSELLEACQTIPNEQAKLYLRSSVTTALDKVKNMYPEN